MIIVVDPMVSWCSFDHECNCTYWSNEYHETDYHAKLLHLRQKWVKNCATELAKFWHSLGETEMTKHWQKVRPKFGRTESSVDHYSSLCCQGNLVCLGAMSLKSSKQIQWKNYLVWYFCVVNLSYIIHSKYLKNSILV